MAKYDKIGLAITDRGFTVVGFTGPGGMTMVNLHPEGRYYETRDEAKDLLDKIEKEQESNPGNPLKPAEWVNCTCKQHGETSTTGLDCLCNLVTDAVGRRRIRVLQTKGIHLAFKE